MSTNRQKQKRLNRINRWIQANEEKMNAWLMEVEPEHRREAQDFWKMGVFYWSQRIEDAGLMKNEEDGDENEEKVGEMAKIAKNEEWQVGSDWAIKEDSRMNPKIKEWLNHVKQIQTNKEGIQNVIEFKSQEAFKKFENEVWAIGSSNERWRQANGWIEAIIKPSLSLKEYRSMMEWEGWNLWIKMGEHEARASWLRKEEEQGWEELKIRDNEKEDQERRVDWEKLKNEWRAMSSKGNLKGLEGRIQWDQCSISTILGVNENWKRELWAEAFILRAIVCKEGSKIRESFEEGWDLRSSKFLGLMGCWRMVMDMTREYQSGWSWEAWKTIYEGCLMEGKYPKLRQEAFEGMLQKQKKTPFRAYGDEAWKDEGWSAAKWLEAIGQDKWPIEGMLWMERLAIKIAQGGTKEQEAEWKTALDELEHCWKQLPSNHWIWSTRIESVHAGGNWGLERFNWVDPDEVYEDRIVELSGVAKADWGAKRLSDRKWVEVAMKKKIERQGGESLEGEGINEATWRGEVKGLKQESALKRSDYEDRLSLRWGGLGKKNPKLERLMEALKEGGEGLSADEWAELLKDQNGLEIWNGVWSGSQEQQRAWWQWLESNPKVEKEMSNTLGWRASAVYSGAWSMWRINRERPVEVKKVRGASLSQKRKVLGAWVIEMILEEVKEEYRKKFNKGVKFEGLAGEVKMITMGAMGASVRQSQEREVACVKWQELEAKVIEKINALEGDWADWIENKKMHGIKKSKQEWAQKITWKKVDWDAKKRKTNSKESWGHKGGVNQKKNDEEIETARWEGLQAWGVIEARMNRKGNQEAGLDGDWDVNEKESNQEKNFEWQDWIDEKGVECKKLEIGGVIAVSGGWGEKPWRRLEEVWDEVRDWGVQTGWKLSSQEMDEWAVGKWIESWELGGTQEQEEWLAWIEKEIQEGAISQKRWKRLEQDVMREQNRGAWGGVWHDERWSAILEWRAFKNLDCLEGSGHGGKSDKKEKGVTKRL